MRVTDDVLTVLSTALRFDAPDQARIVEQLDRKLYLKVNQVLEACGGKWSRRAKAHVFAADFPAEERVEQVLATGEVTSLRADLAFFPTPPGLARYVSEMVGDLRGRLVLEPSAGRGALVQAALDRGARQVIAVERDLGLRDELRAACFAKQGWQRGVHVASIDDFMGYHRQSGDGIFGRIGACLMNPPFKKVGLGDHLDHFRHACDMLKRGSPIAAIMPAGVTFRQDRRHRDFRSLLSAIEAKVTELPADSFASSGTSVRTVLVRGVVPSGGLTL